MSRESPTRFPGVFAGNRNSSGREVNYRSGRAGGGLGSADEGSSFMRALTWQGNLDVRVTDVPDPRIQEGSDAIIAVTSTAICGSDLHLYGVLGPYPSPGDVLGHEAMGVVTEVGADVTDLAPGDRVVIIGVDPVPERRAAAARFGVETLGLDQTADTAGTLIEMTGGRGPDSRVSGAVRLRAVAELGVEL
jgi:threonine dehydrogenase-like Zn-dependent dehydrogenase